MADRKDDLRLSWARRFASGDPTLEALVARSDEATGDRGRLVISIALTRVTTDHRVLIRLAGVIAMLAQAANTFDSSAVAIAKPVVILGGLATMFFSFRIARAMAAPTSVSDEVGLPTAQRVFRPTGELASGSIALGLAMGLQAAVAPPTNPADEVLIWGLRAVAASQILIVAGCLTSVGRFVRAGVMATRASIAVAAGADLAWAYLYMRDGRPGMALAIGITAISITIAGGLISTHDTEPMSHTTRSHRAAQRRHHAA